MTHRRLTPIDDEGQTRVPASPQQYDVSQIMQRCSTAAQPRCCRYPVRSFSLSKCSGQWRNSSSMRLTRLIQSDRRPCSPARCRPRGRLAAFNMMRSLTGFGVCAR